MDQAFIPEKKEWTVSAARGGVRLDRFVRRCLPNLSRQSLEAAIAAGVFRVNGRQGKKGDRVVAGDTVSFAGPANWLAEGPLPQPNLRALILYEDSDLLVVDKPAGMDTHGFSGRDVDTLANFVAAQRPEILGVGKSKWEPGLVHRLDRETSGLVLVAKTQTAFEHLRAQFRRRRVKKHYWALVRGITEPEGSIGHAIARDTLDKRRMQAVFLPAKVKKRRKSWNAITRYRRVSASQRFCLLAIEMETGVTHQIRVHLSTIGHPIVGDTIYGGAGVDALGLKRHFLHACRLEFHHPEDDREVVVHSPLPSELRQVLDSLQMKS